MRQDVENWLKDLGFDIPEIRFDGEFQRFGEKKSSWFVAREYTSSQDSGKLYYAATVGDWKLGEIHHFQNSVKLKPSEKNQVTTQQELYKIRINREQLELYDKSAKDAETIFKTYQYGTHGYADKKGIKVADDCRVKDDFLAIPLRDVNGKFWSFQKIFQDSTKRFFTGGRTKSNFYQFGEIKQKVFICEGYATGYTIFEKENDCVICAMSAGNIPNVAKDLKEKYPTLEFVYMADRDEHGKGEEMCNKAMKITGGELRLPPDGFKDFNDARDSNAIVEIESVEMGPLPEMSGGRHPRPLATINNLKELLKFLKIHVRYNVIGKKEEILIPEKTFSMDNKANASLSWVISEAIKAGIPHGQIPDYVSHLADQNQYNPVATWILSKPWDGENRLQQIYDTVESVSDGMLKEVLMLRWFVSCVAAIFEPQGISAHGMLVFQGSQSIGKTHWFKKLAPKSLEVIKDGLTLRPDDRDSVKRVVSFWLVELGELDATFRKADIAQLKSFITADRDILRLSYARKESEFARRTVFFGSVNDQEFLADKTGNRRFWTIECSNINYAHKIDMQQFWAQIHEIYRNGEPWILQPDELEMLNESNKKYETIDAIEEMAFDAYYWESDKALWSWKTATQCASDFGLKSDMRVNSTAISRVIRKINGQISRKSNGIRQILVPPIKIKQF
jgi:putative DNA primase/helicase